MFNDILVTKGNSKKALANRAILENEKDSGRFGKALEISLKTRNNNKVAGRDEIDKKMLMIQDGKKVYKDIEIKCNGGRIDNIEKSEFIIYGMDVCNSNTKGIRRTTEMVIMRTETFMNILKQYGVIKKINKDGILDGYGIQVSNKAFYETIRDYPIKFIKSKLYDVNEIK